MGKITQLIGTFGAAALTVTILIGCNSGDFVLVAETPTSVYEDYPSGGPPRDKIIAVMNKGDTADVVHTRYAKDAAYYKVRLKDGRKGYVLWEDGKVKIEPVKKN
jgi:hypothetical protein